jgi:hypothetical protein
MDPETLKQAEARGVRGEPGTVIQGGCFLDPRQSSSPISSERNTLETRLRFLRRLNETSHAAIAARNERIEENEKALAELIQRERQQEIVLVPFTRELAQKLSNLCGWNVTIPNAIERSSNGSTPRGTIANQLAEIRRTVDDVLLNT